MFVRHYRALIWNRFGNVFAFEEINRLARDVLLKTKDIIQQLGFELVYADTDSVFLKKDGARRNDYENMMKILSSETGLSISLDYHYKFLVFTGFTFFITQNRLKHSEQIKMAHEIPKQITETETAASKISDMPIYADTKKYRYIQHLNVWEWFALLVNEGEITDSKIKNYFKPAFMKVYKTILLDYKELAENSEVFKEMKKLFGKWKIDT